MPALNLEPHRNPPYIPSLPKEWQAMADKVLASPGTSSDALLILADALDEAAEARRLDQLPYQASLLAALAGHMRHVAPSFAP